MSTSRAGARTAGTRRAPVATTSTRFVAWLVDLALVAGLFSGLWLFGLIRISGCDGFDTETNSFPAGCPFESTREVDGEIVYVLDSGRELPADHPTIEPPLLGIRVVDPPGAGAYFITLVYVLVVFVLGQGLAGLTPGKWLAGTRLADESGAPVGVARAGVRWLVPDGAIALVGLVVALVDGPWALRLLAADGVLRLGTSLGGLLSGTGRGLGDRVARTVVTTASAFELGADEGAEDSARAPAAAPAPAASTGAAWATSAWQPAPAGPPTAEQPAVPGPTSAPAGPVTGPPAASPSADEHAPWAMPPRWPEHVDQAPAPSEAAAAAEGGEAPARRFPWIAEPGAAEATDEGWVAPTMEPPVEEPISPPGDEGPVPPADELVGAPAPGHHAAEPAVDAIAPPPRDPNLPDVAPSAMPPADEAPGEPTPPAVRATPPAQAASVDEGVAPSAAPAAAPSAEVATGATGGERQEWPAGQPVWDPARGTYIFWDPSKGEWLQFDYASGAWGPISRAS